MSAMQSKYVPWDEPWELLLWFAVVVLTTFIAHNTIRAYKDAGRPHP